MRGSAVELLEDCPHCRLEGGLVETYDASAPACRFGVPSRAFCKLCGLLKEGVVTAPCEPRLDTLPTNRCPACTKVLRPEVLDVRRCGECGVRALLADRAPPSDLRSLATFRASLEAWAAREGAGSVEEHLVVTFVIDDVHALHAAFLRGEPLETVGDPFALGGRAGTSREADDDAPPPSRHARRAPPSIRVVPPHRPADPRAPAPTPSPAAPPLAPVAPLAPMAPHAGHAAEIVAISAATPSAPPLSAPPRALLFPLVSVISADGEIHPEERAFVDAFLLGEGMAPLADHELRVYTPAEAARHVPKDRREKIVELMCEVAMVDGLADDAELRVVRAYASAWQISEEKVETWLWGYEHAKASAARQFWLRIRRFVLSSRWENQAP